MIEKWAKIKGFEKYEVSNIGRVKSVSRIIKLKNNTTRFVETQILNIKPNRQGYIRAYLTDENKKEKSFFVHRLVAEYFIPNPENKKFVNHKNGIKNDNNVSNLEWCTCKENIVHAFRTGLKSAVRGSKSNFSKLTEEEILEIRELYPIIKSYKKIADMYKTSLSNIAHIIKKRTWHHLGT